MNKKTRITPFEATQRVLDAVNPAGRKPSEPEMQELKPRTGPSPEIVETDFAKIEERVLGAMGYSVFKTADMGKSEISERRYKALDPQPDEFPNRLCIESGSKYFSSSCAYVGVKIAGIESDDVVEYCISERWVRVGRRGVDGKLERDPKNRRFFLTDPKAGVDIEPFWRQTPSRQVKRALRRVGAK